MPSPEYVAVNLPYPPTANRIWRYGMGRVWTTKAYEDYKKAVAVALLAVSDRARAIADAELFQAQITLFPPDNRKRDIDNPVKALFDAITKSGAIWKDDSQVVELRVRKGRAAKNPFVRLVVFPDSRELDPSPTQYGEEERETKRTKKRTPKR